ncbi:MAG: hypothetical protein ACQKBU_01905, partial [Verrucomicrobiales bacterium]
ADLIRPGGHLFGVFYLRPRDQDEGLDGPPFGASEEEIKERLRPWFRWCWGRVPARSYSGREGREWLACFERLSLDGA